MADETENEGIAPAATWIVVSGEQVGVGDAVTVDLGEPTRGVICDVDGARGLPLVRVQGAASTDEPLVMTPGQIMGRAPDGGRAGRGRPVQDG
ncbi:hypothetical protein CS0771_60730 [Catellatospora sp. IY07-71]|uniref:hypothetical protein n=1 Tax=Catellatospora sp. IY07-71 TaxID=2728827 RepID=UPI001BB3A9EB|nr:hypothetical protein [Catellatospora sp. IY07-71]BCJ76529.1 hypothetical protein CS0771_60730 [Catellatospora sp. IY07-71]